MFHVLKVIYAPCNLSIPTTPAYVQMMLTIKWGIGSYIETIPVCRTMMFLSFF